MMAYIDDYDICDMDPKVQAHFKIYSNRLKEKRARPAANCVKILSTLEAGGYLVEPSMLKAYMLYDAYDHHRGKVQQKTIRQLVDAGFLEYNSRYNNYLILSDEGRGYLK